MRTIRLALAALAALALVVACGGDDSQNGGTPQTDGGVTDGAALDSTGDGALGDAPAEAGGPITTHPTNILANGGFEYGMMCFGEFVQPDGNNDYGFFLSTDTHSGMYSLELRCIGTQCGGAMNNRAFVVTQAFHMPASQAYKLTFFSKCTAGADHFFYSESTSTPYFSKPVTCTGAWAQNEIHFAAKPTDGEGTFYFFNHAASSLYVDDVVLTYEDGTVPVHTVMHPGVRNVTTTPKGIFVDGKPYLALGYFNVPYAELATVQAIKGANVVTTLGGTAISDCFNTDRPPYADRARDLGLDVVPNLTETARLGVPAVFPAVMDAFAPHLANIAFYMADEPDLNHYLYSLIAPATMKAERDAAHTRTALPLLADLQHSHYDPPAIDQPYGDSEDIYGTEPYQEDTSGITQSFKVFATMTPRPVWIFDDNHADVTTVVPKAYYGTILGATGLVFFDWPSLDAANRVADAQAIGELSQLAGPLFATNVTATVTAPMGITFLARSYMGKTYVLAVNPTATTVQGSFSAASLGSAMVTVMFENRTVPASGGAFTDTFTGISRHVYSW